MGKDKWVGGKRIVHCRSSDWETFLRVDLLDALWM